MPTQNTTTPPARKTRVFLVDDHPFLLRCMAGSLGAEPDLLVCGQAGSAAKALATLAVAKPDLVIVDSVMPKQDGLALIKGLKARVPKLLVLVFSMQDESRYAKRALQAGAAGYVMKSAPPQRLLQAIRKVMGGAFLANQATVLRAHAPGTLRRPNRPDPSQRRRHSPGPRGSAAAPPGRPPTWTHSSLSCWTARKERRKTCCPPVNSPP